MYKRLKIFFKTFIELVLLLTSYPVTVATDSHQIILLKRVEGMNRYLVKNADADKKPCGEGSGAIAHCTP